MQTSKARHPKVDPKPGDVLRRGKQERRVYAIAPFIKPEVIGVHYINKSSKKSVVSWVIMALWQTWAKNAEVIHAAD